MFKIVILFCICVCNMQAMISLAMRSVVRDYDQKICQSNVTFAKKCPVIAYEKEIDQHLPLPAVLTAMVVSYLKGHVPGKEIQDTISWFFKTRYECCAYLSSDRIALGTDSGCLKIHNVLTGQCERTINAHSDCMRGVGVASIIYNPFEQTIISGGEDGCLKIWQNPDYACIKAFPARWGGISALLSVNSRIIVSGTFNTSGLNVWHKDHGFIGFLNGCGLGYRIKGTLSLAALDESRFISTAYQEDSVILWDIDAQRKCFHNTYEDGPGLFVSSIKQKNAYALALLEKIVLLDIRSVDVCMYLSGHKGIVKKVAPLGSDVLSVSVDKTAKIWDPRMPKNCKETIDLGPEAGILDLGVSPQANSFAVSFNNPYKVKMWDCLK